MSPLNPKRSRLASTPPPSDPGGGEAPTMAIERGRSRRPIAACARRAAVAGSLIALVSAKAGSKTLVVEELPEALGAAVLGVPEARLDALGHQIVVGYLPWQALHRPHGLLAGAQHRRVLAQKFLGEVLGALTQLRQRHRLVDPPHLGGLLAVE